MVQVIHYQGNISTIWVFCLYISSFILEITKNGHSLWKDPVALYNALFASGSLSCPCLSLWAGGGLVEPPGWQCKYPRHTNSKGKTPSGSPQVVRGCKNVQGCAEESYRVFCKLQFQGVFFLFCRTTNNLAGFVSPWGGAPPASWQELPLDLQFCVWGTFPQHTDQRHGHHLPKDRKCTRNSHAAFLLLTNFRTFCFTVTWVLFHNIPDHAAIPAHFTCLAVQFSSADNASLSYSKCVPNVYLKHNFVISFQPNSAPDALASVPNLIISPFGSVCAWTIGEKFKIECECLCSSFTFTVHYKLRQCLWLFSVF